MNPQCLACGRWKLDPETELCAVCLWDREKKEKSAVSVQKIFIKGYGQVSKARVGELERRVMLPYDKPGGGYYVGRRMENGKISENKQPDYRP